MTGKRWRMEPVDSTWLKCCFLLQSLLRDLRLVSCLTYRMVASTRRVGVKHKELICLSQSQRRWHMALRQTVIRRVGYRLNLG